MHLRIRDIKTPLRQIMKRLNYSKIHQANQSISLQLSQKRLSNISIFHTGSVLFLVWQTMTQ